MHDFWGYASGNNFSVGCTGKTTYVFDNNGKELKKFTNQKYAYTPVISPDETTFVVKTTDGHLLAYSLETLSLINNLRFSKVDGGQDDSFCFSADEKQLINIERQKDELHQTISTYNVEDFSLISRFELDGNTAICCIEYDTATDKYYVLGFSRQKKFLIFNKSIYFVAEFNKSEIVNARKISEKDFDFFHSYKSLEIMGFTPKSYKWAYLDTPLDEIKKMNCSLAKLYEQHSINL